METIIEVKNISKSYSISHRKGKYITLRDVLSNILKNPFRFAKKKVENIFQPKETFWALRNINLNIKKGEIIGIIGPNGAGKSTLLKILSQITPPTTGEIVMHGSVGSLLEVGTGFHPELTGRENIFLNGAILGMGRKEIARKFDEIVEFSGVEKFLDTPVKYYSSGMYVRLAFSVAAHMEPDILLVDEVLAVGDAEFQKKCLGKMEEVTNKKGRTILFVSHNMGAIEKLCSQTMLIEKGEIKMFGNTKSVINEYLHIKNSEMRAVIEFPPSSKKAMNIKKISILNNKEAPSVNLNMQEPFSIEVIYNVREPVKGTIFSLDIYTIDGQRLLLSDEFDSTGKINEPLEPGEYKTTVTFPPYFLNAGNFYFNAVLHIPMVTNIDSRQNNVVTMVDNGSFKSEIYPNGYTGILSFPLEHRTVKINQ